jgi:uncharacterized pyridoxamine 5'-phosphate oxidase family protein
MPKSDILLPSIKTAIPQVRPFGAQNVFEGKLYIQTGLKKKVAKQLLAHPRVAITGMVGLSCIGAGYNSLLKKN